LKAIHLNQQLVEGLFALIVSAAEARATVAAYSVNLVNKDDAGGILLALLKQVTNAAGAHAHKHLYKVRSGDAEERHIGFTGHGPRQQGLTSPRMSYQQDAFGDASAKLLEFLRFTQELNNLPQLFFGFIYARHILERDFLLLHGKQARP